MESGLDDLWIIIPPENAETDQPQQLPGGRLLVGDGEALEGDLEAGVAEGEIAVAAITEQQIEAEVSGFIGSVRVSQRFVNPLSRAADAAYAFPLPERAAVSGFEMLIGERRIRGVVRTREEAQELYKSARRAGLRAALLQQQRPNIFVQKVANIDPGGEIGVEITYFHTLPIEDQWAELVVPTAIGERFTPPGWSGSAWSPRDPLAGASGKPAPRTRVSVTVRGDGEVMSPSHQINLQQSGEASVATMEATGPTPDFVLRSRVNDGGLGSSLVQQPDGNGGHYLALLLTPPSQDRLGRAPVEFTFLLDTSGSMAGEPMESARAAVRSAMGRMRPDDTFQIVRFSNEAARVGEGPMPATQENLRRAERALGVMSADGGTMLEPALRGALDYPRPEDRQRFVVLVSDGQIGNDDDVLKAVESRLNGARVFALGVGQNPNRFLLQELGRVGRGASAVVAAREDASAVTAAFFDRVSHPAMWDLDIEWNGFERVRAYPERIADVYPGRPVMIIAHARGGASDGAIVIRGETGFGRHRFEVQQRGTNDGSLDLLWARARIAHLAAAARSNPQASSELAEEAEQTALNYGIASPFTSFIAVDAAQE